MAADREIGQQLGATDGSTLVKREDEFYELLDARCGDLVVERLRAGALLAGNLIAGAWENAGRPELRAERASPPVADPRPAEPKSERTPRTEPPPSDESTNPAGYVGSRNSKVYHRPDCPHVKRISESNLVWYKSVADAQRQGKRPCRSCKPE